MKIIKKCFMMGLLGGVVGFSVCLHAEKLSAKDARLFAAVENNDIDAVNAAFDDNADANAWRPSTEERRRTPLFLAKSNEVASVLIERGLADVDATNKFGQTPLFYAQTPGIVELLVSKGADVNARDHQQTTPLAHAHDIGVVRALLRNGADINAQDVTGKTPLWTIVEYCSGAEDDTQKWGQMRVIDLLLRRGADTEKQNTASLTIMGDLLLPFLSPRLLATEALKKQRALSHRRDLFVKRDHQVIKLLVARLIKAGASVPFDLGEILLPMQLVIERAQKERNQLEAGAAVEAGVAGLAVDDQKEPSYVQDVHQPVPLVKLRPRQADSSYRGRGMRRERSAAAVYDGREIE